MNGDANRRLSPQAGLGIGFLLGGFVVLAVLLVVGWDRSNFATNVILIGSLAFGAYNLWAGRQPG